MNEGYSLGGTGSAVYINYPSASGLAGKRVYRNSGTSSVYVPTKTDTEVTAFCAVASNVGAVCNDCGWGSWYNSVCQSNSVWQTKIDSSYCGSSYSTGAACKYCPTVANTYGGYYINSNNDQWCYNHTYDVLEGNCCASGYSYPDCPSGYTAIVHSYIHRGWYCAFGLPCDEGYSTCRRTATCSQSNCPI